MLTQAFGAMAAMVPSDDAREAVELVRQALSTEESSGRTEAIRRAHVLIQVFVYEVVRGR